MSNVRVAEVEWQGGMRFEGGSPDGPTLLIDADGQASPGPMVSLLVAAAACSGADVVSMLPKMQAQLRRFQIRVTGLRAEDHPRRYLKLHFEISIAGDGLDEAKARRAIDLSFEKYCSVMMSLNPDIPVSYDLVVGD
ncbi:MAG: OsmC family protein [Gemmatimonadales bacterium]